MISFPSGLCRASALFVACVLVVAMIASVLAALMVVSEAVVIAAFIAGIGVTLPLLALVSTRYVVHDHQLVVYSGVFKWRIPIGDIPDITPTHDPTASPALSLDRLRITYGNSKSVLVSPRDKGCFLRQIESLRRSTR